MKLLGLCVKWGYTGSGKTQTRHAGPTHQLSVEQRRILIPLSPVAPMDEAPTQRAHCPEESKTCTRPGSHQPTLLSAVPLWTAQETVAGLIETGILPHVLQPQLLGGTGALFSPPTGLAESSRLLRTSTLLSTVPGTLHSPLVLRTAL